MFFVFFAVLWALTAALCAFLRPNSLRKIASFLPVLGMAGLLIAGPHLSPGERLLGSCAGLLFLLKACVLLRRPQAEIAAYSPLGLLIYGTIWPGMEPGPFKARQTCDVSDGRPFMRGAVCAAFGIVLLFGTSLFLPLLPQRAAGLLGIGAFLLMVHFGAGEMLPWLLRWAGWNVGPLFDKPLHSATLTDFWGKRWNRPFVQMNQILFARPLLKRLGRIGAIFGIFALSGVFHEGGLSYPAQAGWGGPMSYFLLHGALVACEAKANVAKWPAKARLLWVWGWIFAPILFLFHAPFQNACILPLLRTGHAGITHFSLDWYFDKALWLAGIGHFVILIASFQVPGRLKWKEDFAQLTRFNQKIFWTYGGFIVLSIVSFGVLTLVLHNELLQGERAALGLAAFNAAFWLTRLGTDFFYFKHDDWPKGGQFVVGHTLLTGLFIALATTYTGLVIYRGFFS